MESVTTTPEKSLLFVDVCGSTEILNRVGDRAGRRIVNACLETLRGCVDAFDGQVVDQIGDELMCLFSGAAPALDAASEMQARCANLQFDEMPGVDGGVAVRIGLQYGTVLQASGRVHGDVVHTAKRMVELAKRGQVLTTRDLVSAGADGEFEFRLVEVTRLKGKREPIEVYELLWNMRGLTNAGPRSFLALGEPGTLVLAFGTREVAVGADRPVVSVGRGEDCDLVVNGPSVSRLHARVELRKHGFVLIDLSTNGTLLRSASGKPVFLHRDEVRLVGGAGEIDLDGRRTGEGSVVVAYRLVPADVRDGDRGR